MSNNVNSRDEGLSNVSLGPGVSESLEYKAVSVLLVLLVCGLGIVGNAMVVLVVLASRDMRTPTNCYLLSLAAADLLVLLAAGLPGAADSLSGGWLLGRAGCLAITYLQYLGINASACSISAFTVERYVAICHPLRAQRVCTVSRARRVLAGVWSLTCLYCTLWLFLVDVQVGQGGSLQCGYRVRRELYLPIYLFDFTVFYLLPLLLAIVLYALMARMLHLSAPPGRPTTTTTTLGPGSRGAGRGRRLTSRKQVTKMLAVVVVVFGLLWMPYRSLVLINSLVSRPYLNAWFLLFCRTCIYANSAINPVIYNLMSEKFRAAFRQLYRCKRAEGYLRTLSAVQEGSRAAREVPTPQKTGRGLVLSAETDLTAEEEKKQLKVMQRAEKTSQAPQTKVGGSVGSPLPRHPPAGPAEGQTSNI